jgi:hypothetical protein
MNQVTQSTGGIWIYSSDNHYLKESRKAENNPIFPNNSL